MVRDEVDVEQEGEPVKAYEIYGVVDMLADDVEREHDETQYLVKCADNVWRDQSARITYAVQHIEMKESNEELPIGEWLNFTYLRKPS